MINRRGGYFAFAHDRQADWDFLSAWQPSFVRVMLPGQASDPASVSIEKVTRIHATVPAATILLRCWDVDDCNRDRHREMAADPTGFARWQIDWWAQVFDRIPDVPRNQLMAGLNNEVAVDAYGPQLCEYTRTAMQHAAQYAMRLGVGMFSVGNPGKPGEGPYDMTYFASVWEADVLAGDHVLVLHEYMQPEGMYAVWTDAGGNERHDFENLINRHIHWPGQMPMVIGEWGIDGLLYNRHRDPAFGHSGWRNFAYWPPARFADEYVECCKVADKRVLSICPFVWDAPDKAWESFDPIYAGAEFLARKDACVIAEPGDNTDIHLPVVIGAAVPTGIIEPNVALAIMDVEAGNRGYGPDGRLLIRFEAHIFRNLLANEALFRRYFLVSDARAWAEPQYYKDAAGNWQPIHTGRQETEHAALTLASQLDPEAAHKATAMGIAQIMGFNHARVGYPSAQAMYLDYAENLAAQIVGFFNYMLSDAEILRAVRNKDWRTIARLYNGTGAVDLYSGRLEAAYRARGM